MQRVIALFCVVLLIAFVVPSLAGVSPMPLNKRLEYTRYVLVNWRHFDNDSPYFNIPEPDWSGDFFDRVGAFFTFVRDFFVSIWNLLSAPFYDLYLTWQLVEIWTAGLVPKGCIPLED